MAKTSKLEPIPTRPKAESVIPKENAAAHPPQMITFGMFSGEKMTKEEDFKIAEWHPKPSELDC